MSEKNYIPNDDDDQTPLGQDLLIGAAHIAAYLGVTRNGKPDERRVYYWHEIKAIPTFKIGALIAARKSQLNAHCRSGAAK